MQIIPHCALLAFALALHGCYRPAHVADFEEPSALQRFEVRDSMNRTIWQIECDGRSTLSAIDHGVLPIGCTQVFPVASAPRLFLPGERLLLIYTAPREGTLRFQQHWGKAASDRTFLGGSYFGGPVGKTRLEEIFVPGERPIDRDYPRPGEQ